MTKFVRLEAEDRRPMEQTKSLDVTEAAARLHIKESTVRSWILQRKLPYCKLGRRVFIRDSDAENFINASVLYPEAEHQPGSMIQ